MLLHYVPDLYNQTFRQRREEEEPARRDRAAESDRAAFDVCRKENRPVRSVFALSCIIESLGNLEGININPLPWQVAL